MSEIFITNEFINDCADSSLTLKLFKARFNSPNAAGHGITMDNDTSPAEYEDWWYTDRDPNRPEYNVTGNLYLATQISPDRKTLIVKIPYEQTITSTQMGYLTYDAYINPNDERAYKSEVVAFVFNTQQTKVGNLNALSDGNTSIVNNPNASQYNSSMEGDNAPALENTADTDVLLDNTNNNSYLYLDISKLNVAATLSPIYHPITDSTVTATDELEWNYVDEHPHNLLNILELDTTTIKDNDKQPKAPWFDFFYDASDTENKTRQASLHFANKITATTLPRPNASGYESSLEAEKYRMDGLVQATDGRVRSSNLMPVVDPPTEVASETEATTDVPVTFSTEDYREYTPKLYVKGYSVDLDEVYLFYDEEVSP